MPGPKRGDRSRAREYEPHIFVPRSAQRINWGRDGCGQTLKHYRNQTGVQVMGGQKKKIRQIPDSGEILNPRVGTNNPKENRHCPLLGHEARPDWSKNRSMRKKPLDSR